MADVRVPKEVSVTIADEGSLSTVAPIGNFINGSLIIVTAWTVAGAITFQGSNDAGGTFYDIYDTAGTEVTIPSHATHTGRSYELPAAVMNFRFIKIRSGTTATPVNQTSGPYTLTVALKS